MAFAFVAPADELQIRNLIARYAYATDAGDKEGFADLFLADGQWTRENSPPAELGGSGLPSEAIRGREGLIRLIENSTIGRFQLKVRHQMTDVLVEPGQDDDHARTLFRALVTDWRDGPGRIAMCVFYTALCARTDEGWKFASVSARVLPE